MKLLIAAKLLKIRISGRNKPAVTYALNDVYKG